PRQRADRSRTRRAPAAGARNEQQRDWRAASHRRKNSQNPRQPGVGQAWGRGPYTGCHRRGTARNRAPELNRRPLVGRKGSAVPRKMAEWTGAIFLPASAWAVIPSWFWRTRDALRRPFTNRISKPWPRNRLRFHRLSATCAWCGWTRTCSLRAEDWQESA